VREVEFVNIFKKLGHKVTQSTHKVTQCFSLCSLGLCVSVFRKKNIVKFHYIRLMKNILFLFALLTCFTAFAQEGPVSTIKENGKHFKAIEFTVKKNTFYTQIIPQFLSTSLTVEINTNQNFNGSYVLLGGTEKYELNKDDENTENVQQDAERGSNQSSKLLISKTPFQFFSFYTGNLEGTIRINLLYAAPLKKSYLKDTKKKSAADCNIQPESIDQSIWRVGLPDPAPNPAYSQVKHIILHHAAGSNTDSDYLGTVRNYYLLHTQTNGWDDIGYNFLVAPNGDIYDGRQGDSLGDDNVIGAHMCARNTNTMGICLLGNYQSTGYLPSDTALASINDLIVWKLWKEQLLNAYDSSLHPVTAPVMYLGVIAGHRQGCNPGYTSCPGIDYLNLIEPKVRAQVAIRLANCTPLGVNSTIKKDLLIYPNPSRGMPINIIAPDKIKQVMVYNSIGQLILCKESDDYKLEIDNLKEQGLFLIKIKTEKRIYFEKVQIDF
jgi:hypothetical protein